MWERMKARFAPIIVSKDEQMRRFRLANGSIIHFWSFGANPDAMRGNRYHLFIIDESQETRSLYLWESVIRPTLIDFRGRAIITGSTDGYNWAYRLFMIGRSGKDPDYAGFQYSSYDNPFIPRDELDTMRRTMSDRAFRAEIMAEFIDSDSLVFRDVQKRAVGKKQDMPVPDHQYVIGVDFGKSFDYTVFVVIDTTEQAVVRIDRQTVMDWNYQTQSLISLAKLFHVDAIIAERNGVGEAIIDRIREQGITIIGTYTSNAFKVTIINDLAFAIDSGLITLLHPDEDINAQIMLEELATYEASTAPSGVTRMSAPRDMHDDTVMALALAWHGARDSQSATASYTRFYAHGTF